MSARSLRQIVGAPLQLHAGATLDAAKTAVVFIDYQNEYRQGPLALPDEALASKAARRLRAWADRAKALLRANPDGSRGASGRWRCSR